MTAVVAAILSLFHPQELTLATPTQTLHILRDGPRLRINNRPAPEARANGRFTISFPNGFRRTYEGAIHIRPRNEELELLLTTSVEDLVARTVAAESPPQAPREALAAQAILARSLLAAGPRHKDYAVCDTTHCQVFKESNPAARAAAATTAGLLLRYQGQVFAPSYSSSCGGQTQTASAIGWRETAYPYFSVACQPCRRNAKQWRRAFEGFDADTLREHPHDESVRLSFGRRSGWDALPSNFYQLLESPTGGVILEGRGLGHGLGLCQHGAAAMAAQGASAARILEHYFPNTAVAR
jgi:stage II sporulation protein D